MPGAAAASPSGFRRANALDTAKRQMPLKSVRTGEYGLASQPDCIAPRDYKIAVIAIFVTDPGDKRGLALKPLQKATEVSWVDGKLPWLLNLREHAVTNPLVKANSPLSLRR